MGKWFLKLVVGLALSISLAVFIRSEAFGKFIILPLLGEEAAETSPFDALPALIEMAKKNIALRERDLALKEQAAQQTNSQDLNSVKSTKDLDSSIVQGRSQSATPSAPPNGTVRINRGTGEGTVRVHRGTGEDAVPVKRGF